MTTTHNPYINKPISHPLDAVVSEKTINAAKSYPTILVDKAAHPTGLTETEQKLEELFFGHNFPYPATYPATQASPKLGDTTDTISTQHVPVIPPPNEAGYQVPRSEWTKEYQNQHKVATVPIAAHTDASMIGLNTKLDELAKKVAGLDSNINKAVKQLTDLDGFTQHVSPPLGVTQRQIPKYEFVLSPDDLRELDRLLLELEKPDLKVPSIKKVPLPPPVTIPVGIGHTDYVTETSTYVPGRSAPPSIVETLIERDNAMAKKEGWVTEPDGTRKCYKNGKLHCDTGPAEIRTNGTELYYKNGDLHRDGSLPAMTAAGGTVKYAVNGKYHRLGGEPAISWSKSAYRHEWWENGQIKRAIKKDGTQEWYAPGCTDRDDARLHRKDGPAVVFPNGKQEFWLNGNQYRTRQEWEIALNAINNLQEEALDHELIDEDPIEAYDQDMSEKQVAVKNSKPKEKKMEKPSFAEMMKKNAVEAGYRVAATQSTNIVKNAILAVMKNKGADDGALAGMSKFLETDFGAALIGVGLGSALNYVPHLSDDPRVAKLAEEMRIGGMATAGNAIVGEAVQHVLPALTEVLNKLPSVEASNNVRLEETTEKSLASALEEDEESAETETTTRKVMTV